MGENPRNPKILRSNTSWTVGDLGSTYVLANSIRRLPWALWVYNFSRHNCIFGEFSNILNPKCTQIGGPPPERTFVWMNPKFVYDVQIEWNCGVVQAESRFVPPIFGENSLYQFLENWGNSQNVWSQISQKRLRIRQLNLGGPSAHYRSPLSAFFQDFSDGGLGNPVAPQNFFTNFQNVSENKNGSIYADKNGYVQAQFHPPSPWFF